VTTTIRSSFSRRRSGQARGGRQLSRRGGNLTGVNFFNRELAGKQLALLRELVPAVDRVAVFVGLDNAAITESTLRDVGSAAQAMGLQIKVFNNNTSSDIDAAFDLWAKRPDTFPSAGPFLNSRRRRGPCWRCHAIPQPAAHTPSRRPHDYGSNGGCVSKLVMSAHPQGQTPIASRAIEQVPAHHQCSDGLFSVPRDRQRSDQ
jgi:hypothetical protein